MGQQLHQRADRYALAGARFAHDAQHLALVQRIADAVDRLDLAGRREERNLQILDLQ